jgi:hypothetical protein
MKQVDIQKCIILLVLLLYAPFLFADDSGWRVRSIKTFYNTDVSFLWPINTEIEFVNGHVAKTEVIEFIFIDSLEASGHHFLIYTGRTCTECDMHTSIYISDASESNLASKRYTLPGKIYSYEDNFLLQESRMFYGECLKIGEPTVVWYSNYLGVDNKWHKEAYDVDFNEGKVLKNKSNISYENIFVTEALVKDSKCHELAGTRQTSEP